MTKTNSSITAPLISLAMLKVHWDTRRKDYIDNFVPMVAECIRTSQHDVVSIGSLQQEVRTAFGLRLPQHNLRIILNRIAKAGFIHSKDRVYVRDLDALERLNFRVVQNSVVAMHEQLIGALRSFAHDAHQLNWSIGEAEAALYSYLETYALLETRTNDGRTPEDQSGTERGRTHFVTGAFVGDLRQNDAKGFDYLETILKGDILATAIFLPDPSRAAQKFRKTYVYLDTSVLIYALGYAGESRSAPGREMLDLLYQSGANLRCFSHTADEIRSILTACAYRIERNQLVDSYGPSIEYFLERGFTPSEIRIFVEKLETNLAGLRVEIVDKPPFDPKYMIDEQQLADHIKNYLSYRVDNALWRDVGSISSIIRLRGAHETMRVEECRAVFVSTNSALVRAAREFGRGDGTHDSVPPALTDHALTNMLWLKLPAQANDLPRKRLIAASYAATQPDDKLWSKFLEQLAKDRDSSAVSDEDYYLLRHSLQARAALMDVTLGDEEAFTAGTVQEILEIAKENLRRDLSDQVQRESSARTAAERDAEQTRQALNEAIVTAERDKSALAAAAEVERQRILVEVTKRDELRRTNRRTRAVAWARKAARVLWVGAFLLLLVGSLSTYLQGRKGSLFWYVLATVQGLLFLFGFASSLWGTSVEGIVRSVEAWMAGVLEEWLAKAAGDEPVADRTQGRPPT